MKVGSVNIRKLKGKLAELGMNIAELGEAIGYNKSAIYRRFENNGAAMSLDDANRIIKALKLTRDEAISIFFSQLVS